MEKHPCAGPPKQVGLARQIAAKGIDGNCGPVAIGADRLMLASHSLEKGMQASNLLRAQAGLNYGIHSVERACKCRCDREAEQHVLSSSQNLRICLVIYDRRRDNAALGVLQLLAKVASTACSDYCGHCRVMAQQQHENRSRYD